MPEIGMIFQCCSVILASDILVKLAVGIIAAFTT